MLVELFDLHSSPEIGDNWEETARWIKFEEDVEGLDRHWGRPHISFLPFHTMAQFRKYFENSLVLLDPHAYNLSDVTSRLMVAMADEWGMNAASARRLASILRVSRHRKLTRGHSKHSTTSGHQHQVASKRNSNPSSEEERHPPIRRKSPTTDASPTRQQTSVIMESFAEESEDTANPGNGVSPSANEQADERRTSVSAAGPRPGRPLLRRLSTAIGLGAFDGTNQHEEEERLAMDVPDLTECAHIYSGVIADMEDVRICMVRFHEPKRIEELTTATLLPIRFIFLIAGPSLPDVDYHELGRTAATLISNAAFNQVASRTSSKKELLYAMDDFLDLSIIVPPGDIDTRALLTVDDVKKALRQRKRAKAAANEKEQEENVLSAMKIIETTKNGGNKFHIEDVIQPRGRQNHVADALRRTGRPFGGVIDDIKYRAAYYLRDFRDALRFQCITSAIFLFCANFASAVAFGEVIGDKTDGYMGVTEILLAHGICGVVWGLIACQPLCIQAAVGPFLVIEASLYTLCDSYGLDFLSVRFWTSAWAMVFILMVAMVEGSCLMRYLTRFTEDIFTGLIAFIFIWEAAKYLFKVFMNNPVGGTDDYCFDGLSNISDYGLNSDPIDTQPLFDHSPINLTSISHRVNQPNTALLSLVLILLTFVLTYKLKKLRSSAFFGRSLRKAISDFGVPISVATVIALYQLLFSGTYVEHLRAPDQFSLTDPSKRGWMVQPLGTSELPLPLWVVWACTVPALLVGILIFAQVDIIEILLAKPDRGLRRPHGFHWDLIVCSGLAMACGLFGLPWMCPAAVQSISHASSLTVMQRTAPGAAPKVDHVIEQRVTCIVVGLLHGAAAFAGVALQLIPVPVLFGLFVYLGVMGLVGLQFVQRLVLCFTPQKYFPEAPYCKLVSMWRMHLFTLIQLLCFCLLGAVNMVKETAMAFPFVLTLIALFRVLVMPRIFHSYELDAIDGRAEAAKQANDEAEDDRDIEDDGADKRAIL